MASDSAEEASQFELKPEFHHTAGQKLPDGWVKRWRKWIKENPPEGVSVKKTRFSGDLAAPVAKRPRPQLREEPYCPHCLMGPCVIEMPPDFLVGNADANPGNLRKRFALNRKFWSLLQALGLWHDDTYLQRKRAITHQDDSRELLPLCVVTVRQTFLSRMSNVVHFCTQEIRR